MMKRVLLERLDDVFRLDDVEALVRLREFTLKKNGIDIGEYRLRLLTSAAGYGAKDCLKAMRANKIWFQTGDLHEMLRTEKYKALEYAIDQGGVDSKDRNGLYVFEYVKAKMASTRNSDINKLLERISTKLLKTVVEDGINNPYLPHLLVIYHAYKELEKWNETNLHHVKNIRDLYPIDYLFRQYKADLSEAEKVELLEAMRDCATKMQRYRFEIFSLKELDPTLPMADFQRIAYTILPVLPPVYIFKLPRNTLPETKEYLQEIIWNNHIAFNTLLLPLTSRIWGTIPIPVNAITAEEANYLVLGLMDYCLLGNPISPGNPLFNVSMPAHLKPWLISAACAIATYYSKGPQVEFSNACSLGNHALFAATHRGRQPGSIEL